MYVYVKRFLDFLFAVVLIFILCIPMLLFSCIIKIESKGPIIFKQKRIGKNKKEFYIYKFRTMRIDTPKDMPTHKLENPDKYITEAGKFFRKTSIDELPQIFNVLKGEMSFIGPRPALWNQTDLIQLRENCGANSVLPGISGLAQVKGRDEIEISLKAELDGEYVKNMSFLLDLKICLLTVRSVLKSEGIREGSINNSKNDDKNDSVSM